MNNSHIGKTCPYCQFPIKQDSDIMVCPACKIPHHSDCWQSNDGCTTYACNGEACYQDDDLEIKLYDDFDEKEWLIMRAGVIKGPYTRSELLALSFLEPADKLWNRFTQQWVNAEDLTDSRLWSNEVITDRLVIGSKQSVLNLENKKSVLGLASVLISGVSALGSYFVFNNHYAPSIFQPTLFIIIGLIALSLGIAGLIQKEQEKMVPAIGIVFSFLLIITVMLQTGLNTTPSVYALEIPEIAAGPSNGVVEAEYHFSASKIGSIGGCNVEYCFAWGDGSESGWNVTNTAVNTWTNAGNYQVRVKARCAENSDLETSWSAPLSIIIEGQTTERPLTPVLVSPVNQSTIVGKSVDFHWQPVDDAASYKIYVTRVSDGTAIVDQEVSNNSYTGSGFPDNDTEYQWTVCAGNSAGWSSWSTYWNFTNGSIPAPTPAPEPKPEPDRESEDIYIEWPPGSGNPPGGGTQPPQSSCTQEQSEQIARQYVLNGLSGIRIYSFDLVNVVKFSSAASWLFTYYVESGGSSEGFSTMEIFPHYRDVTVSNCQVISEHIYQSDWSGLF